MTLATEIRERPLHRNLKEQLVWVIGFDIVSGKLRPGELLPPEDTLLSRHKVSRTVLREALGVLAAKGMLDARPKRGTVVTATTGWSQLDPDVLAWRSATRDGLPSSDVDSILDQLMEMRRLVEPGAAALTALRATPSVLAEMEQAYAGMETARSAEEFMQADLAFHVACLEGVRNDFLLPVSHGIRSAMMTSLQVTNSDPRENRDVSLPLHRAILDAIRSRDPAAARSAMEIHLDDTEHRRNRARGASDSRRSTRHRSAAVSLASRKEE